MSTSMKTATTFEQSRVFGALCMSQDHPGEDDYTSLVAGRRSRFGHSGCSGLKLKPALRLFHPFECSVALEGLVLLVWTL